MEPPQPSQEQLADQLRTVQKGIHREDDRWLVEINALIEVARFLYPRDRDMESLKEALRMAICRIGKTNWAESTELLYGVHFETEDMGLNYREQLAREKLGVADTTFRQERRKEMADQIAGHLICLVDEQQLLGNDEREQLGQQSNAVKTDDEPPEPRRRLRSSWRVPAFVGVAVAGVLLLMGAVALNSFDPEEPSLPTSASVVPNGCPATQAENAFKGEGLEATEKVTFSDIAKLYIYSPRSDLANESGWSAFTMADPVAGSQLQYALSHFNYDGTPKSDVVARVDLGDVLTLVPDSTCVYRNGDYTAGALYESTRLVENGLSLGDLRANSTTVVTFKAQVPTLGELECGDNRLSVYAIVTASESLSSNEHTRIWGNIEKPCYAREAME